MSSSGLHAFDSTVQTTNSWLHDIMNRLGIHDRQAAYHYLRVVLHALRDRLSVAQAAALGSQLPMLIRGIFFEGWRPQDKPLKIRHRDEFLDHIARDIRDDGPSAESVVTAVFDVLSRHVSQGEVKHISQSMPKELRTLFAEEFHTLWF
jgi:uncharacterized protein (DUF2267 family)